MRQPRRLISLLFALCLPAATVFAGSEGFLNGNLGAGRQDNVDLSAQGTIDWVVWGYSGQGTNKSLNRDVGKSGGAGISPLTSYGDDPLRGMGQFGNYGESTVAWSDGDPVATAQSAATGIQHNNGSTPAANQGFSFTVPADTLPRRVILYLTVHQGIATMTATLSDSSGAAFSAAFDASQADNLGGILTIDYAAGSPEQTLTITALMTTVSGAAANVGIQAVALSESPQGTVPTTTTLVSAPNPSNLGDLVNMTATVYPSAATGSVVFLDGGTVLDTVPLKGGSASISVSTLTVGSHTLTAAYSGDATYEASASIGNGVAVIFNESVPGTIRDSRGNGTGFTTRLPGTGDSLALNDPNLLIDVANESLTITSTPSDPNGQANLGVADFIGLPLSLAAIGGSQDFTVSAIFKNVLYPATFDQIGLFVGSASNSLFRGGLINTGTPAAFTVQTGVLPSGTGDSNLQSSTALAPSQGDTILLIISRTSGVFSYQIQNLTTPSKSGSIPITQPTFLNGRTDLVAGIYAINPGDATPRAETVSLFLLQGPPQTVLAPLAPSTTTLLPPSPNPATLGQTVTLAATVSPVSAVGSVSFHDGSTVLGTGNLSQGKASLVTRSLGLGSHPITAYYQGDGLTQSSVSSTLVEVVNAAASLVLLTSSINPSTFGQTVRLTATLPPTATGTVAFNDGSTLLNSVTLNGGVATLDIGTLAGGSHSLTAVYSGDGNNVAATSSPLSQLVNPVTTTTSLVTSPNPATSGQPVTLTATVAPPTTTGAVQFRDGSALVGQATLSNGVGVLVLSSLSAGSHSLTASYAGNTNFSASNSAVASETISAPLSIQTSGLPSGTAGQPYSAGLAATGGSGNYSWTASGLPAGLSVSSSGSISGTPTAPSNGSVSVTVSDTATFQSASTVFNLSVTAAPIVISGNSDLGDIAVGGSAGGAFNASGGLPPYKWSLSGLSGFAVDSNGNVRGSAAQAGNFSGSLTVTDSLNSTKTLALNLAVLGLSGTFPAGTTTSPYSGSVTGVGGAPPYSYSASGVPAGLTFSAGALAGQASTASNYTIGVQVTDSKGVSVSGSFPVVITGPAPKVLTITTLALPDGFAGKPYSQALTAAGGSPGYTWAQTGGQLPGGIALSDSGTVSGNPTAVGTFTFGVQVSDASGAQTVSSITINIQPAPLEITTGSSFPTGQAGVDYPAQILTATGGVPPYIFAVKGTLPAGLNFSGGQIAGTPSSPGDFSFTLTVTDSAATPVTAALGVSGTIKPNSPDLILSAATASFTLASGTSAAPSPITIPVSSTVVSQILSFTASSSLPWITVGASKTTPGSVTIALNNAALALNAAGSPYSGAVTVTCATSSCAGKAQTIQVSLAITDAPPQLSLGSQLLSFVALTANPQPSSEALAIVNAGGGSLGIKSISAADSWISVAAPPATVAPGPGAAVTVTVDPSGLKPGYYRSTVTVDSSAGVASIPVTLLLSAASVMTLGPAGTQFSMPAGAALGNPAGSFLVGVSSGNSSFTATVLPGADWLSGGGFGSATPSSPGTVNFAIDQTAAGALATGAYYGTIRVSGSGILNSPQDFQVILNITPAGVRVVPDPEPAGLVFITSGAALAPRAVQLFASSKAFIAYQASASTVDGGSWLSVSPGTGSTSAGTPASVSVTASPIGLKPGVYRGTVSFTFGTILRSVNVTLIVESASAPASPVPSVSSTGTRSARPAPQAGPLCAGAQLVPTQTGLVTNFSAPASWPTPMTIALVDTCGTPIGNGQVVTTFSNGDPPLLLSPIDVANGLYSGTWTPRGTSGQITIQARATVPGYTPATIQIAGQVAPNAAPVLAANGTSDVFHPQVGAGLGPGNIVQIYGSGLASQTGSPAVLPLPTTFNGTSVIIGGVTAPLYYVSPGQVNAQIPFELASGNQYQVIVSANGALTTPQPIQLTTAVPAILQFTSGAVVAQHQDGTLISDAAPAVPGEYVVIYLSGLGATDIPVPSGAPSPSSPPANVVDTPVLTLNGNNVPVVFAGLTPGLVGLYQIDFQVPQGLADGSYQLLIAQSGTASNNTILTVKN